MAYNQYAYGVMTLLKVLLRAYFAEKTDKCESGKL